MKHRLKDVRYLASLLKEYDSRDYSKYPNPQEVRKADKAYILSRANEIKKSKKPKITLVEAEFREV